VAITTLDPRTALVVIDLQKGITAMPSVHPMGEVIQKAAALATAFRSHGLPVVLVNVTGGAPGRAEQAANLRDMPADWAELIADLDQQPSDHLVTKRTWGAFTNTDLEAYLKRESVTQIVLAGVSTSVGVDSTARFASELGLNVTLATDAMTDRNADAHEHCVSRIFPRPGETGATPDVLALLGALEG